MPTFLLPRLLALQLAHSPPSGKVLVLHGGLEPETANLGKFISISIYQLVSSNPQYGPFFTIVHSHSFLFALSFPLLFRHAYTLSHLGDTWRCRVCCVSFPMSFPVHVFFFFFLLERWPLTPILLETLRDTHWYKHALPWQQEMGSRKSGKVLVPAKIQGIRLLWKSLETKNSWSYIESIFSKRRRVVWWWGRGWEPGGLTASDLGPNWQRVVLSQSLCALKFFFSKYYIESESPRLKLFIHTLAGDSYV